MARTEVWESLPSFEIIPGKTFFGLDKSNSHCFTLPKSMTDRVIRFFGLREGKLQIPIILIIKANEYPAYIRWARLDRTNPRKLKKEDIPKRDIVQISWKANKLTSAALYVAFQDAYSLVEKEGVNTLQSALFVHIKNEQFEILSQPILVNKIKNGYS